MATPAQVSALRSLIDDTVEPYTFDNTMLSAQIDENASDVKRTAGAVWAIKASRLAGLVDVTEGSSSRRLGSLYKQALEMATFYGGEPASTQTKVARSGTRPITRVL